MAGRERAEERPAEREPPRWSGAERSAHGSKLRPRRSIEARAVEGIRRTAAPSAETTRPSTNARATRARPASSSVRLQTAVVVQVERGQREDELALRKRDLAGERRALEAVIAPRQPDGVRLREMRVRQRRQRDRQSDRESRSS